MEGGIIEWNDDIFVGPCMLSPIYARTSKTLPTFAVKVEFKFGGPVLDGGPHYPVIYIFKDSF